MLGTAPCRNSCFELSNISCSPANVKKPTLNLMLQSRPGTGDYSALSNHKDMTGWSLISMSVWHQYERPKCRVSKRFLAFSTFLPAVFRTISWEGSQAWGRRMARYSSVVIELDCRHYTRHVTSRHVGTAHYTRYYFAKERDRSSRYTYLCPVRAFRHTALWPAVKYSIWFKSAAQ